MIHILFFIQMQFWLSFIGLPYLSSHQPVEGEINNTVFKVINFIVPSFYFVKFLI